MVIDALTCMLPLGKLQLELLIMLLNNRVRFYDGNGIGYAT